MVLEVMRRVFADRAAYLADPDYSDVPVAGLVSDATPKKRAPPSPAARSSSNR